jgi:hypothetical protein
MEGGHVRRWLVALAWGVFVVWVAWLGWQALTPGRLPVVSRAQLLNTSAVVVADVTATAGGPADPNVKVVEVMWSAPGSSRPAVGELVVTNLPGSPGFSGSGRYVLLLAGQGAFQLAGVPRSPLIEADRFRPTIYPDTPEVRAQIEQGRRATAGP